VKFGYVVPKIYVQTDRQTYRHIHADYCIPLRISAARCDTALQAVYISVVISKLLYASSAWADLLPRLIDSNSQHPLCGFCSSDTPPFQELLRTSDKQLFGRIIHNQHHLLYNYLPAPSIASQNYDLRPCTHNRQLPAHSGHLTELKLFLLASCI